MTLSPVFRSQAALDLLDRAGIFERMRPALERQVSAVKTVYGDLDTLIDSDFLRDFELPHDLTLDAEAGRDFFQSFFFLILFGALFEGLGIAPKRLVFYAQLNFCIKGTITAADNLFDDQDKTLLPLRPVAGPRFASILQLMCFERLIRGVCDRAAGEGIIEAGQSAAVLRGLLNLMAHIGELEGSEEAGVSDVIAPEDMLERVHRVRGGALFSLAFVAPLLLETGESARLLDAAGPAVAQLGTAFQIVDDLTDFEADLGRRTHNLVASEVHHHGSDEEREYLARMQDRVPTDGDSVADVFRRSARAVLERAYRESEEAFEALHRVGFWFPPDHAHDLVHAIVGLDGVERMESLTVGDASHA